jgi:hypothetical protein
MLYIPFSLMGLAGSIFFYDLLRRVIPASRYERMLNALAFFMPNLIFWTSNLGKDSLAFFGISLITWAVVVQKKIVGQMPLIAIGGIIIYMVRPHVILFIAAAFAFGFFFRSGRLSARNTIVFLVSLIAFVLVFNPVMNFVGLKIEIDPEIDAPADIAGKYYEAGMDVIESGAGRLNYGGAATSSGRVNPAFAPLYFVQFVAGPFLWQARKPIQVLSAIENVIYQWMLIYVILNWRLFLSVKELPYKYTFFLYVIIASVLMGMMYTNFGLTVRQKCMILPPFILLFASVWVRKQTDALQRKMQRRAEKANAGG